MTLCIPILYEGATYNYLLILSVDIAYSMQYRFIINLLYLQYSHVYVTSNEN